MAELTVGKGVSAGKIASNVQKKITRAQEKVLQKLGKADETKDLAFEEGVINFNKQLAEGTKLQKDLRAYLAAVKAMHESSSRLQECLADMYDPDWYGKEEMDSTIEDSDLLWTDFHQKLVDHALISMDTYLGQFPDIKARIAKRDRKLVDYDSARHNFAAVNKGKKKEGGIKISKAEEELERAQKVFEDINIDLQEELPSLWNSRVGFYVNTFQSVAGLEEKFHRETGKLSQNMHDILVKLENQDIHSRVHFFHAVLAFTRSSLLPDPLALPPLALINPPPLYLDPRPPHPHPHPPTPSHHHPSPLQQAESHGEVPQTWDDEDDSQPVRTSGGDGAAQPTWEDDGSRPAHTAEPIHPAWDDDGSQPVRTVPAAQPTGDDDGSQPVQVKTMHDYNANDSDELELKAGDVVLVVTYDNADEQDEGWLMGVKEADWLQTKDLSKKGVFPENFTQKM
uniref:Bridging integrator 1b n=1 Tax=Electrophorus electricus TaxID=8005 RepID=A0A4W4GRG0_ELEEL